MRVKIGNTYYDSLEQPIMIILNEHEKKFISEMKPEWKKFCATPPANGGKVTAQSIVEFMEEEPKRIAFDKTHSESLMGIGDYVMVDMKQPRVTAFLENSQFLADHKYKITGVIEDRITLEGFGEELFFKSRFNLLAKKETDNG